MAKIREKLQLVEDKNINLGYFSSKIRKVVCDPYGTAFAVLYGDPMNSAIDIIRYNQSVLTRTKTIDAPYATDIAISPDGARLIIGFSGTDIPIITRDIVGGTRGKYDEMLNDGYIIPAVESVAAIDQGRLICSTGTELVCLTVGMIRTFNWSNSDANIGFQICDKMPKLGFKRILATDTRFLKRTHVNQDIFVETHKGVYRYYAYDNFDRNGAFHIQKQSRVSKSDQVYGSTIVGDALCFVDKAGAIARFIDIATNKIADYKITRNYYQKVLPVDGFIVGLTLDGGVDTFTCRWDKLKNDNMKAQDILYSPAFRMLVVVGEDKLSFYRTQIIEE